MHSSKWEILSISNFESIFYYLIEHYFLIDINFVKCSQMGIQRRNEPVHFGCRVQVQVQPGEVVHPHRVRVQCLTALVGRVLDFYSDVCLQTSVLRGGVGGEDLLLRRGLDPSFLSNTCNPVDLIQREI